MSAASGVDCGHSVGHRGTDEPIIFIHKTQRSILRDEAELLEPTMWMKFRGRGTTQNTNPQLKSSRIGVHGGGGATRPPPPPNAAEPPSLPSAQPSCAEKPHPPGKFSKYARPIPNRRHPWIHHLPSFIPDPTPSHSHPGNQGARGFKSRCRHCRQWPDLRPPSTHLPVTRGRPSACPTAVPSWC
jgi:hypothetical protein